MVVMVLKLLKFVYVFGSTAFDWGEKRLVFRSSIFVLVLEIKTQLPLVLVFVFLLPK